MKNTLCKNNYLIKEILEYFYEEGFSVKQISRKINKKICINNIRRIISNYKLYKEYKIWLKNTS